MSRFLRGRFGVVEVVLWELMILCLELATVLCRATAAGLTCSHTDGDFQEGKTLGLNIYMYIYMSLVLKLHGKTTDLG